MLKAGEYFVYSKYNLCSYFFIMLYAVSSYMEQCGKIWLYYYRSSHILCLYSHNSENTLTTLLKHDFHYHIDGLVQERCNSIGNALELRFSCTNPLICKCLPLCHWTHWGQWLCWLQPTSSIKRTQNQSIQTMTTLLGKHAYFVWDFCIDIVLNTLWALQDR